MAEPIPFQNFLPGILCLITIIVYLIYDWKNVYFKIFAKPKERMYYLLFNKIQEAKYRKDYNPYIILNKYFSEAQILSKNTNETEWLENKRFWNRIYLEYQDKLISKLESDIELKDIQYFEGLIYSKHPKNIETEFELKNIYSKIKSQAITWAKTPRKREQAVRLGYFVIKAGFLTPKDDNQESWLEVWNDELKDSIDKPLTVVDLIKNPWSIGADRSDISIENNMQKIELHFYRIGWKRGIELIENGIDQ